MPKRNNNKNFLFDYNRARNINESNKVIDNMLESLREKTDEMDQLMKEISKSKIVIKLTAIAASDAEMTTEDDDYVPDLGLPKKGKGTKIDIQYKPADLKKIDSSWETLIVADSLIEDLENSIIPNYVNQYKMVSPTVKAMVDNARQSLTEAKEVRTKMLSLLKANGTKFIPSRLTPIINGVEKKLLTGLAGRFSECNIMVYPLVVDVKDVGTLAYYCYFQFTKLKTDNRFTYELFNVLVIGVPTANGWKYQLHTFEGDVLPPHVDVTHGAWISREQEVLDKVVTKLAYTNSINILRAQAFPLPESRLQKSGILNVEGVTDAKIEGAFLKVFLKPNVSNRHNLEQLAVTVTKLVRRAIKIDSSEEVLRQNYELDTNPKCITYTIGTPIGGNSGAGEKRKLTIDNNYISQLNTQLGLPLEGRRVIEDAYRKVMYDSHNGVKTMKALPGFKVHPLSNELIPYDRTKVKPRVQMVQQPSANKALVTAPIEKVKEVRTAKPKVQPSIPVADKNKKQQQATKVTMVKQAPPPPVVNKQMAVKPPMTVAEKKKKVAELMSKTKTKNKGKLYNSKDNIEL